MTIVTALRRFWPILLIALAGWGQPSIPGRPESAGPPPGYARLWIYRTDNPYVTQSTPYVFINGRLAGISRLGRAFYRDVPPGVYTVTVPSRGRDVNQYASVALVAGQTAYVKVSALNWWAGACWQCRINTFYTLLMNPRLAWLDMQSLSYGNGLVYSGS